MIQDRVPFVTAAAIAVVLCSPVAEAQEEAQAASTREEARAHFNQAQTHYNLGRFERALEEYARAYELYPAPALLFNMGQCHRQLGNHERAVFFFRGYLRETEDEAGRAEVEELVVESEAALEAERQAERAREEARLEAERRREAAEPSAPEPEPSSTPPLELGVSGLTSEPSDADDTPLEAEWWFWTLLGGAVLFVAGGIGIGFLVAADGAGSLLPSGTLGTGDWR